MYSSITTNVLDRRRTRRYRLQPDITLSFFAENNEITSLGDGKLLNLSIDGMACKVSTSTCCVLKGRGGFHADLYVSEPPCQLRLPCQLINDIEGAEENEYIVGIEFTDAVDEVLRNKLSEVLRRREK